MPSPIVTDSSVAWLAVKVLVTAPCVIVSVPSPIVTDSSVAWLAVKVLVTAPCVIVSVPSLTSGIVTSTSEPSSSPWLAEKTAISSPFGFLKVSLASYTAGAIGM